jgi:Ran GTPase-activating protein (RanGAP) involved in mRNA processing and transport
VQDSQHDTPITIALKECAYFLLAYGEQNEGGLDDGTSYADEQYALYYPEVDDLRDDIYNNGEFVHDLCIPHLLTSADMLTLQDEGFYREPAPQVLVVSPKKPSKMDVFGNRKFTEEELAAIKLEKKRKARARMLADKAAREKASVFAKRFPEDELIDDYEVGKMSCWSVIGMNVPETNLFMDASIAKKMLKNNNYSYELPDYDMVRGKVVHRGTLHMDHTFDGQPADAAADIENNIVPASVLAAQTERRPKTPGGSFVPDKDLQYVVRTSRRLHPVAKDMEVPMTHPDIRALADWDKRPRRGRGTSMRRDSNASASQLNASSAASDFGGTNSRRSSVHSLNSDLLSTGSGELISRLTKLNSAKADHETRWRICKFAEILMSEEMSKSCSRMRWNISDFKAFNKLASATQGKVAQNLAMTCSLNAPPGFVRVSEWSAFAEHLMYDEAPDSDIPMIVKTIVSMVGAAETATKATTDFLSNAVTLPSLDNLRGRARRRRKSSRSLSHKDNQKDGEDGAGSDHGGERLFSDRIIQYLAESYVCSNSRLNLDDAELSYNGRVGWRAIARALRLKHCSFVLPSLFVPPKLIRLTHLTLTRNEMDCGDAVLLSDIFTHQLDLIYVDVSYNRIGGRGMSRIAQALRDHPHIRTFKIDHNIIGPAAGKNVGVWIKKTRSLRVLSMSHNRMGEIVRFPTIYSREKILSAVHDIFAGVKSNKSLEILDLSYNHLGPDSGDVVPPAVNRHPRLHTLNFAGNDLGPVKGTKFLFYLSGFPGGAAWSLKKEAFIANVKRKQAQDEENKQKALKNGGVDVGVTAGADGETDDGMDGYGMGESMVLSEGSTLQSHPLSPAKGMPPSPSQPNALLSPQSMKKSTKKRDSSADLSAAKEEAEASCVHPCSLTSVSVADNQLSPFAGHAIGSLIERNKSLTHLDISGNALNHIGGTLVSDQLELMFGIKPREFLKIVLWEIEESKYTGRNPKKRVKIFTTLTSLNMSRNGIGPTVAASLFYTLAHPNCTITNLDVSDNPLGYTIQQGGNASDAGVDVRLGMAESRSLRFLNLNRTHILPVEMVAILGGLVHNKNLMKIQLADLKLDEPSCLQLCTGIESCESLAHIDLQRCHMGANGSTLVAHKIAGLAERLRYLDLTDNYMGPVAAVYISEALLNPKCKIRTLRLARNDLIEEGGCFIAKSLIGNLSVTDVDLSGNFLTHAVAVYIADAARGLFENGKKITDSKFRRVLLNDNPDIGSKASKTLVKALANDFVEHLELRNIGARAGTASIIASSVRDPEIAWRILDVADNDFSRTGLNEIFWAMRRNRRLRILRCGENKAGTKFCSNADALLSHGLSVPNCLRINVVLRELDLSYNTMSAEAGINIMDAMIDNHTVKKLSLRGNLLDDSLAPMLGDLLRCNNVLEELDVGRNKLGFTCAFALAEALEVNRSLKRLLIDYNSFGGAGTATLEAFSRSLMMNYSLQNLVFDGNKLGPSWGVRLAETFARNNTLLQVSLRDNRLDTRSGQALLKAYRHAPHLLELALSADEIGQELWEQFRLQFEVKRASIAPGEYFQETTLSATQSKIISSYTLFH